MSEKIINEKKEGNGKIVASVIFGIISVTLFVFYCIMAISTISTIGVEDVSAIGLVVLIPVTLIAILAFSVFDIIWFIISLSMFKKGYGKRKTFALVMIVISLLIMAIAFALFAAIFIKNNILNK